MILAINLAHLGLRERAVVLLHLLGRMAQRGQPDLGKRHFLMSSKAEEARAIRPGLPFGAAS